MVTFVTEIIKDPEFMKAARLVEELMGKIKSPSIGQLTNVRRAVSQATDLGAEQTMVIDELIKKMGKSMKAGGKVAEATADLALTAGRRGGGALKTALGELATEAQSGASKASSSLEEFANLAKNDVGIGKMKIPSRPLPDLPLESLGQKIPDVIPDKVGTDVLTEFAEKEAMPPIPKNAGKVAERAALKAEGKLFSKNLGNSIAEGAGKINSKGMVNSIDEFAQMGKLGTSAKKAVSETMERLGEKSLYIAKRVGKAGKVLPLIGGAVDFALNLSSGDSVAESATKAGASAIAAWAAAGLAGMFLTSAAAPLIAAIAVGYGADQLIDSLWGDDDETKDEVKSIQDKIIPQAQKVDKAIAENKEHKLQTIDISSELRLLEELVKKTQLKRKTK